MQYPSVPRVALSLVLVGCFSSYGPVESREDMGAREMSLAERAPVDLAPVDLARPDPGVPVVWAHSSTELVRFDPVARRTDLIGAFFMRTGSAPSMTDLAVRADGAVFTVSIDSVFEVNVETAEVRVVVEDVLPGVGLSFLPPAADGSETLLLATTTPSAIYRVDLDSGEVESLLPIGDGCFPSGDLASVLGVGTYVTLICEDDPTQDYLALVDLEARRIERVGPIGFVEVWGLGFWGGELFGFTDFGELIAIDTSSGRGRLVIERVPGGRGFWGAGSNPNAPLR